MPAGIHHVDLAVADVERSIAFHLDLLGPLGWAESIRYDVGIEHLAFRVGRQDEVDDAYARCLSGGVNIHFPPEEDRDEEGYYAFFAFDPDGIRVEVFCWQADTTT